MATLEQIQSKLKKLQAQAEVMLAKKAQTAVDQIRALMLEHGLTTADIETKTKLTREGKTSRKVASSIGKVVAGVKTKGAAKYRHPRTGATWSGRGRAPAWIADAKDRTKFLIESTTGATVTVSGTTAGKPKAAAKKLTVSTRTVARTGQPKGPQPAMYRDPKSGATWSGRGRAPAWLGTDRGKFLIDGAIAESGEAGASATAKPKTARVSKAVGKKNVVDNVVAKKAATRQATAGKRATGAKVSAKKVAGAPVARKAVAKKTPGRTAAAKKVAATAEVVPAIPVVSTAEAVA
ncbi:H-NS family nucleoid-associated regulatory protein [Paraburkholderia sp. RL17-347-BIC-D]|uniref:H-NS family nucleoid-associated regulatory protein n=1 Tax=Paraburkholderia sp. RL17-347-BIC-D TaxID=3031632 RepID=UPI0038B75257